VDLSLNRRGLAGDHRRGTSLPQAMNAEDIILLRSTTAAAAQLPFE
jgi:hypothetical protein